MVGLVFIFRISRCIQVDKVVKKGSITCGYILDQAHNKMQARQNSSRLVSHRLQVEMQKIFIWKQVAHSGEIFGNSTYIQVGMVFKKENIGGVYEIQAVRRNFMQEQHTNSEKYIYFLTQTAEHTIGFHSNSNNYSIGNHFFKVLVQIHYSLSKFIQIQSKSTAT